MRVWIELTHEWAWGPVQALRGDLAATGYSTELITGTGPPVLAVTGTRLGAGRYYSDLLPPRHRPGRRPDLKPAGESAAQQPVRARHSRALCRMNDGTIHEVRVRAWRHEDAGGWRCLVEWGDAGTNCTGWYLYHADAIRPVNSELLQQPLRSSLHCDIGHGWVGTSSSEPPVNARGLSGRSGVGGQADGRQRRGTGG
jgi:hypothetical protein